MHTVSIADFRKNMATYLDLVKYERQPILLGKRRAPDFVVIPTTTKEDREMYGSKNFWKKIEAARKDVREGRYYTLEEVEASLARRRKKLSK